MSFEFVDFNENYYKCSKCSTLISKLRMPEHSYLGGDDSDRLYGKEYWTKHVKDDLGLPDIYERSRKDLPRRCTYWLRDIMRYRLPPARTLELGCAHGGLTFLLKMAGYDSYGTEMSPWLCEFAQATFDIPMMCGRIQDILPDSESFDIIILMDVLEHMPDPVDGLAWINRSLKDDGFVVIQTPCWRETQNSFEQMQADNSRFLELLTPEEHLYLFNELALKQILERTGFKFQRIEKPIFEYDTFVFASRKPMKPIGKQQLHAKLIGSPSGRAMLALIDAHETLFDCERKLAASRNEAESYRASYSWKIAAPLRWARRLILKARNFATR